MIEEANDEILLLSYNILLPNSKHGWWVSKYYDPSQPEQYWQWEYRKTLLKKQLLSSAADILALQETSPETLTASEK